MADTRTGTSKNFHFDREKYLQILKAEGVQAALTALHRDTTGWEYEAFEGSKGYQPEMWQDLHQVRAFSRELWEIALQQSSVTGVPEHLK